MAQTITVRSIDSDCVAPLRLCTNAIHGRCRHPDEAAHQPVGVRSNQAMGGVGSILSLAKERLPGMDFTALSTLIPGSESLMKTARELGAVTGPVGDRAGLTSAFSRLGMGSEMVPKFTQIMSDFVGKAGGEPARNLLATAVQ